MTTARILTTPGCMAEGAAWLAAADPAFGRALELCGPPPLRRRPDGFAALFEAIVSQQVSTQAARAIIGRVEAAGLRDPSAIAAADDEGLRACRGKKRGTSARLPRQRSIMRPCAKRLCPRSPRS